MVIPVFPAPDPRACTGQWPVGRDGVSVARRDDREKLTTRAMGFQWLFPQHAAEIARQPWALLDGNLPILAAGNRPSTQCRRKRRRRGVESTAGCRRRASRRIRRGPRPVLRRRARERPLPRCSTYLVRLVPHTVGRAKPRVRDFDHRLARVYRDATLSEHASKDPTHRRVVRREDVSAVSKKVVPRRAASSPSMFKQRPQSELYGQDDLHPCGAATDNGDTLSRRRLVRRRSRSSVQRLTRWSIGLMGTACSAAQGLSSSEPIRCRSTTRRRPQAGDRGGAPVDGPDPGQPLRRTRAARQRSAPALGGRYAPRLANSARRSCQAAIPNTASQRSSRSR